MCFRGDLNASWSGWYITVCVYIQYIYIRVPNHTVHGAFSKWKWSSLSPCSGNFGVSKGCACHYLVVWNALDKGSDLISSSSSAGTSNFIATVWTLISVTLNADLEPKTQPNTNDLYIYYMDKSTGTPSLEEKKTLPNCATKKFIDLNIVFPPLLHQFWSVWNDCLICTSHWCLVMSLCLI